MPNDTSTQDAQTAATTADRVDALLLLPWYANGTLGAGEAALVERALRASPDVAAELRRVTTASRWLRAAEEPPRGSDRALLERMLAKCDRG